MNRECPVVATLECGHRIRLRSDPRAEQRMSCNLGLGCGYSLRVVSYNSGPGTEERTPRLGNQLGVPPHLMVRGTDVRGAKLTEEIVRSARKRHQGGITVAQLARDYGVSHQAMAAAVNRKTWRHVS